MRARHGISRRFGCWPRDTGVGEVAEMTSFGLRWVKQLVARYNAEGPEALSDLRRRDGAPPSLLTPGVIGKLRTR